MVSRQNRSDKNLIAEQPGMTVFLIGFVLAFIIGYTAKSLLSPGRVRAHIEKAASHIHKDVSVSFGTAYFSLSDGILPEFAIVITQVKMESTRKCWGAPILEVDEVRLPLSLVGLLNNRKPVRAVDANQVLLTLREDFSDCAIEEKKAMTSNQVVSAPLVKIARSGDEDRFRNDIGRLHIQKLEIISFKNPQLTSELLNFSAVVKSVEPRVIELRAKNYLLRDAQVGDYLSHANLFVEFRESPELTLQAHYFGNWREGHYSLIGNYNFADKMLAVELDLKHIPLSQMLNILRKYNVVHQDFNSKNIWISTKARLFSSIENLKKAPLEIKDFHLEGDLGEINAERVAVTSLEPFRYEPIAVDIQRLDIERLLYFLGQDAPTKVLGQMGAFSGSAQVVSDKEVSLRGEHRGLEFVFSNKGQRETQVIDRMLAELKLKNDSWNAKLARIEPLSGVFVGDVELNADKFFKKLDVKTRIDEMSLAPRVQKLMTSGGEVGALSLNSQLHLEDGKITYLKGTLGLAGMSVERVLFGKSRAVLGWKDGAITLDTQMDSLTLERNSPAGAVLIGLTESVWWKNNRLELDSFAGQFHSSELKKLEWKNVKATIDRDSRLFTEGSWNPQGALTGSVLLQDENKRRKWLIGGSREVPQFQEISINEDAKK